MRGVGHAGGTKAASGECTALKFFDLSPVDLSCVDECLCPYCAAITVHCRLLAREAMSSLVVQQALASAFDSAQAHGPSIVLLEDLVGQNVV